MERMQNRGKLIYQSLINKGLNPVDMQAGDAEGGSTQKIIFPGMLVNYNGIEVPVNFLKTILRFHTNRISFIRLKDLNMK